jgi:hypothetical protein
LLIVVTIISPSDRVTDSCGIIFCSGAFGLPNV